MDNRDSKSEVNDPYVTVQPSVRRRGVLADEVAGYIRQLILTGALRPGIKIDQDAVGRALNVSRSPIREALVVLGYEGLLDLTPRRGASVAHLSREDIVDHYELFGVVSGRAAAMAAELLDDDQIRELSDLHSRFTGDDQKALQQLNHDFHRVINLAAPSRTRWLLRHLERTVPANYYEFADGWNLRAVEHHATILEAIAGRDPEGARRAMEDHLHESGVAATSELEERGFFADPGTGGPAGAEQ